GVGSAAALGANGDIVAAGCTTNSNIGVAAYLPNGLPDTSFGNNGTTTAVGFSGLYSSGLATQRDGNVVITGTTGNTSGALARLQAPNSKITSFTANPNPVTVGSSVTLTASNILNSNPTSTITQVF